MGSYAYKVDRSPEMGPKLRGRKVEEVGERGGGARYTTGEAGACRDRSQGEASRERLKALKAPDCPDFHFKPFASARGKLPALPQTSGKGWVRINTLTSTFCFRKLYLNRVHISPLSLYSKRKGYDGVDQSFYLRAQLASLQQG